MDISTANLPQNSLQFTRTRLSLRIYSLFFLHEFALQIKAFHIFKKSASIFFFVLFVPLKSTFTTCFEPCKHLEPFRLQTNDIAPNIGYNTDRLSRSKKIAKILLNKFSCFPFFKFLDVFLYFWLIGDTFCISSDYKTAQKKIKSNIDRTLINSKTFCICYGTISHFTFPCWPHHYCLGKNFLILFPSVL